MPALAAQARRPEEIIAALKAHPAVAPLVEGGELKEYSAHLIPEGGYDMMPALGCPGMLVAGDAAALCLAAGIWLEGVNFAMGSGMVAGQVIDRAMTAATVAGADLPAATATRSARTFVLKDHRKLRARPAPGAVRPGAAAATRPWWPTWSSACSGSTTPTPKPGLRRILREERHASRRALARPAPRRAATAGGRSDEPAAEPAWPRSPSRTGWPPIDFVVGERAHITVDGDACRGCTTKACVVACPANLFVPTADGGILFNYEQCFECGTCYLVCNTEGAITWTYPDGGNGVVFRRT